MSFQYEASRFNPIRKVDSDFRVVEQERKWGGASEERIVEVESFFKCSLPSDYRLFLKTINGGEPASGYDPDRGDGIPDVAAFWGTNGNNSSLAEDKTIESVNRFGVFARIPFLIEVAGDGYGRPFCLVVDGSSRGKVYHLQDMTALDDLKANDTKAVPKPFVLIADSFKTFYEQYCLGFP